MNLQIIQKKKLYDFIIDISGIIFDSINIIFKLYLIIVKYLKQIWLQNSKIVIKKINKISLFSFNVIFILFFY